MSTDSASQIVIASWPSEKPTFAATTLSAGLQKMDQALQAFNKAACNAFDAPNNSAAEMIPASWPQQLVETPQGIAHAYTCLDQLLQVLEDSYVDKLPDPDAFCKGLEFWQALDLHDAYATQNKNYGYDVLEAISYLGTGLVGN